MGTGRSARGARAGFGVSAERSGSLPSERNSTRKAAAAQTVRTADRAGRASSDASSSQATAGPTDFALLRSRSSPILSVQLRTPPVGASLGPCLARHLARQGRYLRLTHLKSRQPLRRLTFIESSGASPTSLSSGSIGRLAFHPSRVQSGETRSSKVPASRDWLRKWFRITIVPPGFTTRLISRSTPSGSGTALITYVASARSNSLSAKSMAEASITLRVTLPTPSSSISSWAFSSILSDRSIPVRQDAGEGPGEDRRAGPQNVTLKVM